MHFPEKKVAIEYKTYHHSTVREQAGEFGEGIR
jgi:hypothetical protein